MKMRVSITGRSLISLSTTAIATSHWKGWGAPHCTPQKHWNLSSSLQRSNAYTISWAHRITDIRWKGKSLHLGQQRTFSHTAEVCQTPVRPQSFWGVWIKSADTGRAGKRKRELKMENWFASRPLQYPLLFLAMNYATELPRHLADSSPFP